MTPLELLACLAVGAFIGVGALGLGYGIFALASTAWDAVTGSSRRVVSVRLSADLRRCMLVLRSNLD